ncbi:MULTISPECIES: DUF3892 domain-containing protein [Alicyclobacillus]|uniref:DUF3892 domain-containing protein n=1 Tax=Alicyclobacillus acidoterrestris (strain ATCC 49025 / DSM 3922 / CIP 106132 / NCIMB 13137 / GD3B) TaxID=1356854 RepID=T0D998_ALIAG|nr:MULTISPECIES: DUF3892 domain-containing protein [Alicyclobacillus]EPZ46281.1 hypothetical protein N007_07235 [Alicyclobacillus acidoterrestris ATCC 49025]UNO47093.1 DUF3892 domain-containing protein [Alicyclobacillus acidoterrestris]
MPDQFEEIYNRYVAEHQPSTSDVAENDGKERIVAVRKNDDGDIIAVRTDKGRDLDYVSALQEAKSGNLAHVDVFHKYGRDILRSEPDGIRENNLDNLPEF